MYCINILKSHIACFLFIFWHLSHNSLIQSFLKFSPHSPYPILFVDIPHSLLLEYLALYSSLGVFWFIPGHESEFLHLRYYQVIYYSNQNKSKTLVRTYLLVIFTKHILPRFINLKSIVKHLSDVILSSLYMSVLTNFQIKWDIARWTILTNTWFVCFAHFSICLLWVYKQSAYIS